MSFIWILQFAVGVIMVNGLCILFRGAIPSKIRAALGVEKGFEVPLMRAHPHFVAKYIHSLFDFFNQAKWGSWITENISGFLGKAAEMFSGFSDKFPNISGNIHSFARLMYDFLLSALRFEWLTGGKALFTSAKKITPVMNEGIYETTYNVQPLSDNMMGAFNPMKAPSVAAAATAFFGKKVAETQEGNAPINTNAVVSYKSIPYDHGIDFPSLYDPSTNKTLSTRAQGMTIHNPQDEPPVRQSHSPPHPPKTHLPLGTTEQNFIKLFKPHENNVRRFVEEISNAVEDAVATNDAEKLRNKIDKVTYDESQAVLLYENQVPGAVKKLPPHTSIFPSNKREVAEWKESNYARVKDALTEAKEVAIRIEKGKAEAARIEHEQIISDMTRSTLKKVVRKMDSEDLKKTAEEMGVPIKTQGGYFTSAKPRPEIEIRDDIIQKITEKEDVQSLVPTFPERIQSDVMEVVSKVLEEEGLEEAENPGNPEEGSEAKKKKKQKKQKKNTKKK